MRYGLLAYENRSRDVLVGDAERTRRQRRAVERRAQFSSRAEHEGYEERRPRVFLSHRRREADRGHYRSDRRVPARSNRRDQAFWSGRREGREGCAAASDACRDQGHAAAEGYDPGEILAPLGSAREG